MEFIPLILLALFMCAAPFAPRLLGKLRAWIEREAADPTEHAGADRP